MIVSSFEQAKTHLPSVNTALLNSERLNDFFQRAQEWLTEHIIGDAIEQNLEAAPAQNEPDIHARLRLMARRLISELGLRMAVPEMDLQLSEAGFVVQNNQQFSPASQQRVDRLIATLDERMTWDCDAMVRYLVENSSPRTTYTGWRGTEQYAYLTQAFTPSLEAAVRAGLKPLPGQNPIRWTEFIDMMPDIAQAIRNVAAPYVSEAEIDRLLELYRDNDTLSVHKRAIKHLAAVGVLEVSDQHSMAVRAAIHARKVMLAAPSYFTAFYESDAVELQKTSFGDGPSFNGL